MMKRYNSAEILLAVAVLSSVFNNAMVSAVIPSNVAVCNGNREIFVEDSITVDLVSLAARDAAEATDCYWKFSTNDNRILLFTASDNLLLQFITIYDGSSIEKAKLMLTKQEQLEKYHKDSPPAAYTTGYTALVYIDHAKLLSASRTLPINALQLKISKAVTCPFNLGTETQCGRVVDPESCYCAVFTKGSWLVQKAFCERNNFSLVELNNPQEEQLIVQAWGGVVYFWTSANDIAREGFWIWEGLNLNSTNLYPWGGGRGYANWAPGQPDTIASDEDCMEMNFGLGWNDDVCTKLNDAICESQP